MSTSVNEIGYWKLTILFGLFFAAASVNSEVKVWHICCSIFSFCLFVATCYSRNRRPKQIMCLFIGSQTQAQAQTQFLAGWQVNTVHRLMTTSKTEILGPVLGSCFCWYPVSGSVLVWTGLVLLTNRAHGYITGFGPVFIQSRSCLFYLVDWECCYV